MDYLILGLAAFLAGTIDAVAGGGGLVQLPALFAALPANAPATLLGTSKLAGVWGTAAAALTYARQVRVEWRSAAPAACAAFVLAFAGAYTVTHVPPDFVRKLLPFVLLAVAWHTFRSKGFGSVHAPVHRGRREIVFAMAVGGAIGFYDGFFGPGTGSFLIFLFIRFFGFDFLGASAAAKIVNVACNLAALLWFGYSGHVLWQLGAVMAGSNIAGSLVGTRLALKYGTAFIRPLFLIVVIGLIGKTAADAFFQ
jgi:uncharacterized membrane protein YfcA